MNFKRVITVIAVIAVIATAFPMIGRAASAEKSTPDFAVGQVWSIKSPVPTTAKIVIGRIEPFLDKTVVHVSVIDVPLPEALRAGAATIAISHMPFEKSALAASVGRLVATDASPAPAFETGYDDWKSNKGGIYTIDVQQAIDLLFKMLAQRNGIKLN